MADDLSRDDVSSDDEAHEASMNAKKRKRVTKHQSRRAKPLTVEILFQIFETLGIAKDEATGTYKLLLPTLKAADCSSKYFAVTEWQCFRKRIMNHGFEIVDEQQSAWIRVRPNLANADGVLLFEDGELRRRFGTPCKIKSARERGEVFELPALDNTLTDSMLGLTGDESSLDYNSSAHDDAMMDVASDAESTTSSHTTMSTGSATPHAMSTSRPLSAVVNEALHSFSNSSSLSNSPSTVPSLLSSCASNRSSFSLASLAMSQTSYSSMPHSPVSTSSASTTPGSPLHVPAALLSASSMSSSPSQNGPLSSTLLTSMPLSSFSSLRALDHGEHDLDHMDLDFHDTPTEVQLQGALRSALPLSLVVRELISNGHFSLSNGQFDIQVTMKASAAPSAAPSAPISIPPTPFASMPLSTGMSASPLTQYLRTTESFFPRFNAPKSDLLSAVKPSLA